MQKSVFQMLLDVKTRGSNNIRRLGRDLQGVQGKAKNLASSFRGLSKPLIALAGIGGGAALIRGIFGSAAELESQTRSLQVLTGSAEKTKQIVGEIKAFGAATPFQVRDLIDVTKKLRRLALRLILLSIQPSAWVILLARQALILMASQLLLARSGQKASLRRKRTCSFWSVALI